MNFLDHFLSMDGPWELAASRVSSKGENSTISEENIYHLISSTVSFCVSQTFEELEKFTFLSLIAHVLNQVSGGKGKQGGRGSDSAVVQVSI